MKRRDLLLRGAAAICFASLPTVAGAQPTPAELMAPGPLPELSLGAADAPVTVIEYASLTCPHCRNFHLTTWPVLRERYVDTGKVRFIFREFPFDPRAQGGFMLARCAGGDKWYPTLDLLYRSQDGWARGEDATGALKSIMGMTGMTGAAVEACLADQALLDKIVAVAEAGRKFGVDSTPTFFINGKMETGAMTIEQFSALIDPLLAGAR